MSVKTEENEVESLECQGRIESDDTKINDSYADVEIHDEGGDLLGQTRVFFLAE